MQCKDEIVSLYKVYCKSKAIIQSLENKPVMNNIVDFTNARQSLISAAEQIRHIAQFHCQCPDKDCVKFYNKFIIDGV